MFKNSVKLFRLMGIEIRADPSWLLIAAVIVWSLSSGYFPAILPEASDTVHFLLGLFGMLGLFSSLILHELSHSLTAQQLGVRIRGITLFLFGGVAEMESAPTSAQSEFWIAIAGPAMSFALAAMAWFLGLAATIAAAPEPLLALLSYLALVNLILAIFNLLPALPLDGGRIYRALLWARSGDLLEATRQASIAGRLLGFALVALGVVTLFGGGAVGGLWQILIGMFVMAAAGASYEQELATAALEGRTAASLMSPHSVTTHPDRTLASLAQDVMFARGVSFVPVVEDGRLLGYVDSHILKGIDREHWAAMRVGDVYARRSEACEVAPGLAATEVLQKIAETSQRKFMVTDGARLLGVLSFSDLVGYLKLFKEMGDVRTQPGLVKPQRRAMF